jgi:hypothetical protein
MVKHSHNTPMEAKEGRGCTGLFKMIHPISNDYIFEVYK